MGEASLQLYMSTANRAWLTRAQKAAEFIYNQLKADEGKVFFQVGPEELKIKKILACQKFHRKKDNRKRYNIRSEKKIYQYNLLHL